MTRLAVLLSLTLCAGCVPILVGSTGSYQDSNFGTVSLAAGFTPDPLVTQGRSGGQISAESAITSGCRGYITSRPDHILTTGTGFNFLRVMVNSPGDTTLIIQAPDGSVMCNDDGGSGLNPMLQGSFPPGNYYVWVGSYSQGQYHNYRLGFTELMNVTDVNF